MKRFTHQDALNLTNTLPLAGYESFSFETKTETIQFHTTNKITKKFVDVVLKELSKKGFKFEVITMVNADETYPYLLLKRNETIMFSAYDISGSKIVSLKKTGTWKQCKYAIDFYRRQGHKVIIEN